MELKNIAIFLFDALKILLVALAIVIPVRLFLFQPFVVNGSSMEPNYHSGDYLIIDELTYRMEKPQRDQIIVFKYPLNTAEKYIKRIIGLPGETVELKGGYVYITNANGKITELNEDQYISSSTRSAWVNNLNYGPRIIGANEYFVMGDNRNYSSDSRIWGLVPETDIIGKVSVRLSPYNFLVRLIGNNQAALNNN